mmetsp:Transcript_75543/g.216299  ORF Transcript_75543/g.216299 Transcript_75543/m.216299 type:complete len:286 (+) Transcript_75543:1472-2329(+)
MADQARHQSPPLGSPPLGARAMRALHRRPGPRVAAQALRRKLGRQTLSHLRPLARERQQPRRGLCRPRSGWAGRPAAKMQTKDPCSQTMDHHLCRQQPPPLPQQLLMVRTLACGMVQAHLEMLTTDLAQRTRDLRHQFGWSVLQTRPQEPQAGGPRRRCAMPPAPTPAERRVPPPDHCLLARRPCPWQRTRCPWRPFRDAACGQALRAQRPRGRAPRLRSSGPSAAAPPHRPRHNSPHPSRPASRPNRSRCRHDRPRRPARCPSLPAAAPQQLCGRQQQPVEPRR